MVSAALILDDIYSRGRRETPVARTLHLGEPSRAQVAQWLKRPASHRLISASYREVMHTGCER